MRRLAVGPIALAVVLAAKAASAAPPDCNKVERAKKKAGRVAMLLAVAKCHHDSGQYKAAWYEYTEAAARAREARDKRSLAAAQRGEQENAGLLAWVTVTSSDRDAVLEIDGEKTVSGAKKAVDPGKHVVRATGPHRPAFTKELSLQSGDVEEVTVPAAEPDVTEAAPAAAPKSAPPPEPASSAPSASASASTDSRPDRDRPADALARDDEPEPHVGVAADLDALIQLYDEVQPAPTDPQTGQPLPGAAPERKAGQAYVFVASVAYDFTPELRAFVRYGIIDNYAPGRSHAASLSNPVLGASYGFDAHRFVRLGAEAGLVLPLGSGSGDTPAAGIAAANVRGRALYPTMFDPNYLTPFVGVSASSRHARVVGRLELGLDPSLKTSGGSDFDTMKTRLRVGVHAGYRVIPLVEPFVEVRWFRFLSTPKFVEADSALADNLFAGIGVAAALPPFRAQVAYLRAFDAPLVRDSFSAIAFRLGADF